MDILNSTPSPPKVNRLDAHEFSCTPYLIYAGSMMGTVYAGVYAFVSHKVVKIDCMSDHASSDCGSPQETCQSTHPIIFFCPSKISCESAILLLLECYKLLTKQTFPDHSWIPKGSVS